MTELSNIVIADLLRRVVDEQGDLYQKWEDARDASSTEAQAPARVLIVIEEAHEFLSAERADKMPILFERLARIAKRGRQRWLGLVFVTQLPQHLPRQVFGLVNSFVLHKIADPQVVSTLEKTELSRIRALRCRFCACSAQHDALLRGPAGRLRQVASPRSLPGTLTPP